MKNISMKQSLGLTLGSYAVGVALALAPFHVVLVFLLVFAPDIWDAGKRVKAEVARQRELARLEQAERDARAIYPRTSASSVDLGDPGKAWRQGAEKARAELGA